MVQTTGFPINKNNKASAGAPRPVQYTLDTPEPALSHRFRNKNHEPMIQPSWRGKLHAYLGGIIRTAGGIAESVGGVSDHVHLLIGLRATHCPADVLRELKAISSG